MQERHLSPAELPEARVNHLDCARRGFLSPTDWHKAYVEELRRINNSSNSDNTHHKAVDQVSIRHQDACCCQNLKGVQSLLSECKCIWMARAFGSPGH